MASRNAPLGSADWYRLIPVDLPNGDNVATVEAWKMPGVFEGVTTADMMKVRVMAAEADYRNDPQSADWIGNAVAEVLDLDVVADKKRIKALLKTWISNGVPKLDQRIDEHRHKKTFVVPGELSD
jgi:hypothetical protein